MNANIIIEDRLNELVDYEKNFKNLNEIMGTLRTGNVSLVEQLKKFKEGVALTDTLTNMLKTAKHEVIEISKANIEASTYSNNQDQEDIPF